MATDGSIRRHAILLNPDLQNQKPISSNSSPPHCSSPQTPLRSAPLLSTTAPHHHHHCITLLISYLRCSSSLLADSNPFFSSLLLSFKATQVYSSSSGTSTGYSRGTTIGYSGFTATGYSRRTPQRTPDGTDTDSSAPIYGTAQGGMSPPVVETPPESSRGSTLLIEDSFRHWPKDDCDARVAPRGPNAKPPTYVVDGKEKEVLIPNGMKLYPPKATIVLGKILSNKIPKPGKADGGGECWTTVVDQLRGEFFEELRKTYHLPKGNVLNLWYCFNHHGSTLYKDKVHKAKKKWLKESKRASWIKEEDFQLWKDY